MLRRCLHARDAQAFVNALRAGKSSEHIPGCCGLIPVPVFGTLVIAINLVPLAAVGPQQIPKNRLIGQHYHTLLQVEMQTKYLGGSLCNIASSMGDDGAESRSTFRTSAVEQQELMSSAPHLVIQGGLEVFQEASAEEQPMCTITPYPELLFHVATACAGVRPGVNLSGTLMNTTSGFMASSLK